MYSFQRQMKASQKTSTTMRNQTVLSLFFSPENNEKLWVPPAPLLLADLESDYGRISHDNCSYSDVKERCRALSRNAMISVTRRFVKKIAKFRTKIAQNGA
jgi:hypothetical protein